MYREIECHEFAPDDPFDHEYVAVGEERRGYYTFLFAGPQGLETSICFNRVSVESKTLEFSAVTAERRHVKTGSIEGQPQDFGAVGAWLDAYSEDPHAFEGVRA